MSKKFFPLAVITAMLMSCSLLAGCSGSNTSSNSSSSDVGTSEADSGTALATPVDTSENYNILKNAKLGDKIDFSTYRYNVSNGQSTYYIHGRYVIVSEGTVMQTRDEIEVPDAGMTIGEILELDPDFDIAKAEAAGANEEGGISFYGADGTAAQGDLDSTLNSTVTDCVAEYVEWENAEKTVGKVQSYLFTYGYVPVKITGYYTAPTEDTTSGTESTTSGSDTATNGTESTTSGTESTTSGTETTTSGAEADNTSADDTSATSSEGASE